MIRYERRFRAFAMGLSALAGFVDASGFVITGGLFVSFMSGNSTRLAVAMAHANASLALAAAGLVGLFLAGVVAGALIAPWKPSLRKSLVLTFSTAMLVAAAVLTGLGHNLPGALVLAFAMGALNNVFLREGEVSIAVTYMTGTLVRAGQRIAGAMRGEGQSDWLPYLLLWASLVSGAAVGAVLAAKDAELSVWVAACTCGLLALVAYRLERSRTDDP